jgi:hypothetical protein
MWKLLMAMHCSSHDSRWRMCLVANIAYSMLSEGIPLIRSHQQKLSASTAWADT